MWIFQPNLCTCGKWKLSLPNQNKTLSILYICFTEFRMKSLNSFLIATCFISAEIWNVTARTLHARIDNSRKKDDCHYIDSCVHIFYRTLLCDFEEKWTKFNRPWQMQITIGSLFIIYYESIFEWLQCAELPRCWILMIVLNNRRAICWKPVLAC